MCWFILWAVHMEVRIYSRRFNGRRVQWGFGGDGVHPWYEEEDLPLYAYYSDSSIQYLLGHWAFWNPRRSIYAWGKAFHMSSSLHFHSLWKEGTNKIVLTLFGVSTFLILTFQTILGLFCFCLRFVLLFVCLSETHSQDFPQTHDSIFLPDFLSTGFRLSNFCLPWNNCLWYHIF